MTSGKAKPRKRPTVKKTAGARLRPKVRRTHSEDESDTVQARYVFLDIEGFTHNRSVEAQAEIVAKLNACVSAAVSGEGIADDSVIYLPTGDGLCIAIVGPLLPYDVHMRLALRFLAQVSKHNRSTRDAQRRFEVRVGINENVDNLVTDINGRRNVAGAGINTAQRVMSLADGGQILVSAPVFEFLRQREKYTECFRPFSAEVKHGARLQVHQYVGESHPGLSTVTPSAFASPRERPLSRLEAYYFAHVLRHRAFLLSQAMRGQTKSAATVLLHFLAKDSVEVESAEPGDAVMYSVVGEPSGATSMKEKLEHYEQCDFHVCWELAHRIEKDLALLARYFEGPTFLFVNEEGAAKLKEEQPDIWKGLGLDESEG